MPFEFSGPPLEIFRHVHEMKAARIIPPEFLCQPQARFGPFSEIPCIHGASPASTCMSKDIKPKSGCGCSESSIRRTQHRPLRFSKPATRPGNRLVPTRSRQARSGTFRFTPLAVGFIHQLRKFFQKFHPAQVRFVPKADITTHSITSSASASNLSGTAMSQRSPLGQTLARERMFFNLEQALAKYLASSTNDAAS
jgi:hypothetical protein